MKTVQSYWLYMLECQNGTFYTGHTKNLAVRYYQHRTGVQGAKYTRGFKPVKIAQCWRLFGSIATALKVERFIKKQTRATKLSWVQNPDELKGKIINKLDLDLNIVPFDCQAVEMEAGKMDWKKVKSGFDPFAENPLLATEKSGAK
jgi:putative endonuclease